VKSILKKSVASMNKATKVAATSQNAVVSSTKAKVDSTNNLRKSEKKSIFGKKSDEHFVESASKSNSAKTKTKIAKAGTMLTNAIFTINTNCSEVKVIHAVAGGECIPGGDDSPYSHLYIMRENSKSGKISYNNLSTVHSDSECTATAWVWNEEVPTGSFDTCVSAPSTPFGPIDNYIGVIDRQEFSSFMPSPGVSAIRYTQYQNAKSCLNRKPNDLVVYTYIESGICVPDEEENKSTRYLCVDNEVKIYSHSGLTCSDFGFDEPLPSSSAESCTESEGFFNIECISTPSGPY